MLLHSGVRMHHVSPRKPSRFITNFCCQFTEPSHYGHVFYGVSDSLHFILSCFHSLFDALVVLNPHVDFIIEQVVVAVDMWYL